MSLVTYSSGICTHFLVTVREANWESDWSPWVKLTQSSSRIKSTITVVLVCTKHERNSQFPREAPTLFSQDPWVLPLAFSVQDVPTIFPSNLYFQFFAQRHKIELSCRHSDLRQLLSYLLLIIQKGLSRISGVPNGGSGLPQRAPGIHVAKIWSAQCRNAVLGPCWLLPLSC